MSKSLQWVDTKHDGTIPVKNYDPSLELFADEKEAQQAAKEEKADPINGFLKIKDQMGKIEAGKIYFHSGTQQFCLVYSHDSASNIYDMYPMRETPSKTTQIEEKALKHKEKKEEEEQKEKKRVLVELAKAGPPKKTKKAKPTEKDVASEIAEDGHRPQVSVDSTNGDKISIKLSLPMKKREAKAEEKSSHYKNEDMHADELEPPKKRIKVIDEPQKAPAEKVKGDG